MTCDRPSGSSVHATACAAAPEDRPVSWGSRAQRAVVSGPIRGESVLRIREKRGVGPPWRALTVALRRCESDQAGAGTPIHFGGRACWPPLASPRRGGHGGWRVAFEGGDDGARHAVTSRRRSRCGHGKCRAGPQRATTLTQRQLLLRGAGASPWNHQRQRGLGLCAPRAPEPKCVKAGTSSAWPGACVSFSAGRVDATAKPLPPPSARATSAPAAHAWAGEAENPRIFDLIFLLRSACMAGGFLGFRGIAQDSGDPEILIGAARCWRARAVYSLDLQACIAASGGQRPRLLLVILLSLFVILMSPRPRALSQGSLWDVAFLVVSSKAWPAAPAMRSQAIAESAWLVHGDTLG